MSTKQSAPEKQLPPVRHSRAAIATACTVDALLLMCAVAVLAAAALLSLGGPGQVVLPLAGWVLPGTCTFKVAMGVGCPGCGLTRCFISLAHGNLATAWQFSPVGILMFSLVAAQVPYRGWKLWRASRGDHLAHNTDREIRATLWILGTVLVLLAAQWIFRLSLGNVP